MLRYKTETRPGLVALYDIRPGNGVGPFLQPRSPHGAQYPGEQQTRHIIWKSQEQNALPSTQTRIHQRANVSESNVQNIPILSKFIRSFQILVDFVPYDLKGNHQWTLLRQWGKFSLSLSILMAIFQGTKDNGSGGNNWIYKTCKDPVKSSPTNRHPTFYRPDTLPVATNSVRALKRKYHISGFSYFCNILHECWTFTLTYNCPVLLNGRCSSLLRVVVSEMTYIYCVEWDVKL